MERWRGQYSRLIESKKGEGEGGLEERTRGMKEVEHCWIGVEIGMKEAEKGKKTGEV